MKQFGKFLAEVGATVVAAVVYALSGDNSISAVEGIHIVTLGLGAVAVLGAGNLPAGVWAYTKSIVAAATAGAVFLESAVTDGINGSEWLGCLLAVLGAVGVYSVAGPVVEVLRGAGPQRPGVADHAA